MTEINKSPVDRNTWLMDKIGKPLLWIGTGFVLCKILEAYTESKRVKRIAQ